MCTRWERCPGADGSYCVECMAEGLAREPWTIRWAPNPLLTVVELTDAGRRILRLALKAEWLEENLWRVHFAKSLDEARTAADVEYVSGDKDRSESFEARLDRNLNDYVQALIEEHDGDCVCSPVSCLKCQAEGLLGIDTIKGLGKHEATKIIAAFEDGRTLDEAVAWLRDYRPVYKPMPLWPEEEWSKHIPRWTEEGKRAHEWLAAYRDAHPV